MTSLVVKCTWGAERPEALLQAFTVAATAAASGVEVSLWLTGDAVLQAVDGVEEVHLPHSPSIGELRETILASGTLTACAPCLLRRDLRPEDLLPGVRVAGSATFLEELLRPDARGLVY